MRTILTMMISLSSLVCMCGCTAYSEVIQTKDHRITHCAENYGFGVIGILVSSIAQQKCIEDAKKEGEHS